MKKFIAILLMGLWLMGCASTVPLSNRREAEALRWIECLCGQGGSGLVSNSDGSVGLRSNTCRDGWYTTSSEFYYGGFTDENTNRTSKGNKVFNSDIWQKLLKKHYRKDCAAYDIPAAWSEYKAIQEIAGTPVRLEVTK